MMDSIRIVPLLQRCVLIVSGAILGLFVLVATGEDEEEWTIRQAIIDNLQPFGKLCLIGEDCGSLDTFDPTAMPRGTGLSGKGVYDKFCSTCHEEGVSEAPLVASEAWEPRVAQGYDVLLKHTKEGFGDKLQMPVKGNCLDCTDEELEAAILYLITGEVETESEEEESQE